MNPGVTLPAYIGAQIIGAIVGVWLAHIMFDWARKLRDPRQFAETSAPRVAS